MLEVRNIPIIDKKFTELNPVIIGEHKCAPGNSYGPAITNYTIIHYVLSGKGSFVNQHGTYKVSEGEAFIINPGEVTQYSADKDNPWHHMWIGFNGAKSTRFKELSPIINPPGKIFKEMLLAEDYGDTAEEYLLGKLYEIYAVMFSGNSEKEDYILKITNYVNTNFQDECDVYTIAKMLNLERHYLSRMFHKKTGKTLKNFITEKRMEQAKKLLSEGNTVAHSAYMSGYKDPFLFSKTFKKMYGIPPKSWKRNI